MSHITPSSIQVNYPSGAYNTLVKPNIVHLTFKVHGGETEMSAIICGNLTLESTIKGIIDEYSILDKFYIGFLDNYTKVQIKKYQGIISH